MKEVFEDFVFISFLQNKQRTDWLSEFHNLLRLLSDYIVHISNCLKMLLIPIISHHPLLKVILSILWVVIRPLKFG